MAYQYLPTGNYSTFPDEAEGRVTPCGKLTVGTELFLFDRTQLLFMEMMSYGSALHPRVDFVAHAYTSTLTRTGVRIEVNSGDG